MVKVAWEGDEESLHEGDALELWDGDASVRLLRRSGRALLADRAIPGDYRIRAWTVIRGAYLRSEPD